MSLQHLAVIGFAFLLAGCATASSEPTQDTLEAGTGASTDTVQTLHRFEVPVNLTGSGATNQEVCVPNGPDSCIGFFSDSNGDQVLVEDRETLSWRGRVVVTWQAVTPNDETLTLAFQTYLSCGASCRSFSAGQVVQGTSPLQLDLEPFAVDSGAEGIAITVRPTSLTPSPTYAVATAGIPFQLRADLLATREEFR
ncbi:MAG: hypothetical protein AABX89_04085 [Candidatus Thermoplasmatota archaeon]